MVKFEIRNYSENKLLEIPFIDMYEVIEAEGVKKILNLGYLYTEGNYQKIEFSTCEMDIPDKVDDFEEYRSREEECIKQYTYEYSREEYLDSIKELNNWYYLPMKYVTNNTPVGKYVYFDSPSVLLSRYKEYYKGDDGLTFEYELPKGFCKNEGFDILLLTVINCYDLAEIHHNLSEYCISAFVYSEEEEELDDVYIDNTDARFLIYIGLESINSPIEKIKHLAYELYKTAWVVEHIDAKTQLKVVKDYVGNMYNDNVPLYSVSFSDYIEQFGYNGEIYSSYDEFLNNEFTDKDYLSGLFKDSGIDILGLLEESA